MKYGIIGAVRDEVSLLFEALRDSGSPVRSSFRGNLEVHEGILAGCSVAIVCCGVGKVNAALCAQILISSFGVEAIINTGSAGGIDESLAVLDMVVCTDAVQHDFDVTAFGYPPGQIPGTDSPFWKADEKLREVALIAFDRASGKTAAAGTAMAAGGKMIAGRIASGDAFVTDASLRARIISNFSPACVEMEGAAIAQVAAVNGIPFAILRSISDLAGHEASMSYEEFAVAAAHTSARVVMAMLDILKE